MEIVNITAIKYSHFFDESAKDTSWRGSFSEILQLQAGSTAVFQLSGLTKKQIIFEPKGSGMVLIERPMFYSPADKIVLVFELKFSIFEQLRTVRFLLSLWTETELSWAQVVAIISF